MNPPEANLGSFGAVTPEHEALIQFLYIAPVGLVQTTLAGEIVMINPVSAQLLMPLSRDGTLDNLFTALEPVAPSLRELVGGFAGHHGAICEGLRLTAPIASSPAELPRVLALSLLKLDEDRLMAVLRDDTLQLQRELQLRRSEGWLAAIMQGAPDYALLGLDAQGRIDEWNPSIERLTGYTREALLGQATSLLEPVGAAGTLTLSDRLREADQSGWSLSDGWRQRADGSRFRASVLIAPLRDLPAVQSGERPGPPSSPNAAYCMVIRDLDRPRTAGAFLPTPAPPGPTSSLDRGGDA